MVLYHTEDKVGNPSVKLKSVHSFISLITHTKERGSIMDVTTIHDKIKEISIKTKFGTKHPMFTIREGVTFTGKWHPVDLIQSITYHISNYH